MYCTKCGKEIVNDICPYCGNNSRHKNLNINNKSNLKNIISKLLLVLLGAISLFWILGSIIMFSNSDQALSDRIGSGILFLVLAIIFMIPFFIIFKKYLKNTKAERIAEKAHKKLAQEEQMQLKYKEILEHKEKIKNLESENEAKEKYIDTIHEKTQQNIENQQISQPAQELMNPAEILLLKIDSVSTSGVYFENIACRLLESNGFENIRNTPASGDYGIDILAEKDGISYAIQCKCYSNNIGNKAVQEAFSGKQFYNCMVAVVFTNSHFTKSAIETAKATNVLLWDREKLIQMINAINENDLKELTNISTLLNVKS